MNERPLDRALVALGDRWSLQIVEALLAGPKRYNDLVDVVGGIAPNVLAARLRHLEAARLVEATPYQERPRRMSYALTADGSSLGDVLRVLASWASRSHGGEPHDHHSVCGTPLEWRAWCPTCEELAQPSNDAGSGTVAGGEQAVWL
jgi:DNA-binding HxlR family transcriptional regulator